MDWISGNIAEALLILFSLYSSGIVFMFLTVCFQDCAESLRNAYQPGSSGIVEESLNKGTIYEGVTRMWANQQNMLKCPELQFSIVGLQGNREQQLPGPQGRGVAIALGFLPEAVDFSGETTLPTLSPLSHLLDPPTDQTQPTARGQEGLGDAVLEFSLSRAEREKNRGKKKAKVRMPIIYFQKKTR